MQPANPAAASVPVPSLSVLIVNYNGLAFLPACLDSLNKALQGVPSEIIVVDNGSADGSGGYLRGRDDIRLIEAAANLGFTGGNNLGARVARGEFLLLLNADTVCLTSLQPLLACMDDPQCGAAGGGLFYADGRIQPSIGYDHQPLRVVLSWLGLASLGLRLRAVSRMVSDAHRYREPWSAVDWVTGACLLTRAGLWQRLGGLDDAFFMYCEDVDYCRRVRSAGYRIRFTPQVRVMHYEGAGRPWAGEAALRRTARSYLIFMNKHHGRAAQWFVGAALGMVFLCRAAAYGAMVLVRPADSVRREKAGAYRGTATYLLSHALDEMA